MASCLVPDFPAVVVALEHLKELDKELKEEGMPPEASLHLTEITSAITELEADRRAAHEHLEVATIENSKLRHQFNNTRERISQDIMADVAAARASNTEEIEQLNKDLLAASQLQEAAVERREALLTQNEALFPGRDQVKAEHEDAVAALNHTITQKYALQMQLDQTKEKIEHLKSLMPAIEQEKLTLQQNAALERDAFATSKDNLSKELDQTDEKIKRQRQETRKSRRELGRADEKKREANRRLEELTIETAKIEGSVRRLAASRGQCEKNLEGEIHKYQEQKTQRETLKRELCELGEAFRIAIQCLKEDIAAIEDKMEAGRASRVHYQDALAHICEVFKRQHEEENEVRAEHCHVSQQLERSKLQLEERIASIVKHRKEVKEMDKQIGELVEAETINKRVFERNQDELFGNMDTEKQNVSDFEEEKKQLGQLLEEGKRKQEDHVAKMTSDISETRRRFEELRREEAALHRHQPLSTDVELLMSHVIQCEADYKQRETKQREEIRQCTAEVESVMRSREEKQREVEEKEEPLKEVEARWSDEVSRHEGLKMLNSELRKKRSNLKLSIHSLKENIISLPQTKQEKKEELEAIQTRYIELLDEQASELRCVEMKIYDSRVKLEEVGMENSRLQLCIRQMTEDVTRARQDKDRYRQEVQQFKEDTKSLFESLQGAWREDLLLIQDRQSKDGVLLTLMSALLDHLKSRRHQLGHVSTLLHQQILDFSR